MVPQILVSNLSYKKNKTFLRVPRKKTFSRVRILLLSHSNIRNMFFSVISDVRKEMKKRGQTHCYHYVFLKKIFIWKYSLTAHRCPLHKLTKKTLFKNSDIFITPILDLVNTGCPQTTKQLDLTSVSSSFNMWQPLTIVLWNNITSKLGLQTGIAL